MRESATVEVQALRKAVNVSRDGVVIVGIDGHVSYANPAWLLMHGCDDASAARNDLEEAAFHTQAQLFDVRLLVNDLARSGHAQRKVGHRRLDDGRVFDTWTSAAPLSDDLGAGRVEVVRDLSVEPSPDPALLRETNAFLDSVVENIPDMVFVKDAKDLRFVRFNRAGEELLGRTREELLGKNDYDFFPRAEADFFTAQDRAALRSGNVVDIREEPIHTANGLRWLHTKKIPITDECGRPRYLIGIAEDITERRLADERQRVLAQTSVTMATSPDVDSTLAKVTTAVVPTLADGCCLCVELEEQTLVNVTHRLHAREERLREVLRERLYQRDPMFSEDGSLLVSEKAVCPLSPAQYRGRRLLDALGARAAMLVPLWGAKRNDSSFSSSLSSSLSSSNAPSSGSNGESARIRSGWLALWYDVSEARYEASDLEFAEKLAYRVAHDIDNAVMYVDLRRAEGQAKDALRVRDEFLAVASHELRTPLSALQLALQRIDRVGATALGSAELEKMISLATRQVTRLGHLLNNVLDVSRILNGQLTLNRERVDFAETVVRAVELHVDEARARGCALDVRVDSSAVGCWDPLRIEQVVTNLLTNAIKYAPNRPIEISTHSTPYQVELVVRDHGEGIPPDSLDRIFGRFEQAVPSRSYGGLGLGLYITRQIVEAHGGTITVSNCPDGGARMLVELPLGEEEAEGAAP